MATKGRQIRFKFGREKKSAARVLPFYGAMICIGIIKSPRAMRSTLRASPSMIKEIASDVASENNKKEHQMRRRTCYEGELLQRRARQTISLSLALCSVLFSANRIWYSFSGK